MNAADMLIDLHRRLEEQERLLAVYKEALLFYGNRRNWTGNAGGDAENQIIDDCNGGWTAGVRARKALEAGAASK